MITISAGELEARSERLGLLARLEDEGPPADGMLVLDGSAGEWWVLDALPGDTDPSFIDALARVPAVTVARVRGSCSGFVGTLVQAVDMAAAVGFVDDAHHDWVFEGTEEASDAWLNGLAGSVGEAPVASATAALLLRNTLETSTAAGLAAESTAYAMLQAGEEFRAWLRMRQH